MMLQDGPLYCLGQRWPEWQAGVLAAIGGDVAAEMMAIDFLEEQGVSLNPFVVGESYFICTATLYYVGRVKETGFGWITLEQASWIHWTGRLSALLARKRFSEWPSNVSKPRVEPCGEVRLWFPFISDYPWGDGELPTKPVS